MNTDLLRRTADLIELYDRFDLTTFADWVSDEISDEYELNPTAGELLENCNTTGCVAGWVCATIALDGTSYLARQLRDMPIQSPAAKVVARALCLTPRQEDRLFYAHAGSVWANLAPEFGWPVNEPGTGVWDVGGVTKTGWRDITAVQAAKVLRMIADGEVEL